MLQTKKLILVVNDDGYLAQGIEVLAQAMKPLGDVIVVAPDDARSGSSCSISSTLPIHLRTISEEPGLKIIACSGTPADCVKLALEYACPRQPDMVVSGINHGDNASVSLHYSGTMGAALEACMKGLPAIGFSLRTHSQHCNFQPYLETVVRISKQVLKHGLPQDVCLNVNFPEVETLQGSRVCRMARGRWVAEWQPAQHPHGADFYWLAGQFSNLEPEAEDTDMWALDHGYASIVPIRLDMTSYETLSTLNFS